MDQTLYAIQERLSQMGHDPGPLDGVWGARTRDAIAAQLGVKRVRMVGSSAAEAPWFDLARAEIGVKEVPGAGNNPAVVEYLLEASGASMPDSTAWCAGFVGAMLKRAGYRPSGSLMARSYLDWGAKLEKPRKGCIVVFKRGAPPAGHVAFADDWTATDIRVIGGNQSDAVTVASFSRASILGLRWPSETLKSA